MGWIMSEKTFVSWNVNGLRACVGKDFALRFKELDADIFCIQETKLQQGQIDISFDGYYQYWNYAERKGYSGTAVFTKAEPLSVTYGLGVPELDTEGRVITLEFPDFYFVTIYTPNSRDGLVRIDFRVSFEDALRGYLSGLDRQKPVVFCGDLNVAHNDIDLKNPQTNHGNPGFSDEERRKFEELLNAGFTDTFRFLYPELAGMYSWWSYRFSAREKNVGWRIDYFLVSNRLKEKIKEAKIHSDIFGSDHCPVSLCLSD